MNRALETAHTNEAAMQRRLQAAEQQLQQAKEEHHRQILAKEEELSQVKEQNAKLIRDKEQIIQQHIQEAYQMNISLHHGTIELETAL